MWRWETTGYEEERDSSVAERDLSEPEGAGGGPEPPAECTSKGVHLTQNQQAISKIVCTRMMTWENSVATAQERNYREYSLKEAVVFK